MEDNKQPPRIAVLLPNYGGLPSYFFQHWLAFVTYVSSKYRVHVVSTDKIDLQEARGSLVDELTKGNLDDYDFILFLDTDVIITPQAFEVLLSQNLDVVSAAYYSRNSPTLPVVRVKGPDGKFYQSNIAIPEGRLLSVDGCGLGCFLMKAKVLKDVIQKKGWPLFKFVYDETDKNKKPELFCSEDLYFCNLIKECGYKIFVHTGVNLDHQGSQARRRDYLWHATPEYEMTEIITNVADFLNMPKELVEKSIANGPAMHADAWNAYNPKTPKDELEFYKTNHTQIFDLFFYHYHPDKYAEDKVQAAEMKIRGRKLDILDYGCGIGVMGKRLLQAGDGTDYNVTFADLPSRTFDFCKFWVKATCDFSEWERTNIKEIGDDGTLEPFPLTTTIPKFDVILCYDVLEHVPDPIGTVKYLHSLLKDKGELLYSMSFGKSTSHPMHHDLPQDKAIELMKALNSLPNKIQASPD